MTTRYVEATARARPDGVSDLVDPALAAIALAWAVRDVVVHLDGGQPSTWSRTLLLGPDPTQRREDAWLRHPMCACCFADDALATGTG